MTPTQFTASLSTIPYSPRQPQARGIIAPIMRVVGHITFLLVNLAMPEGTARVLTPEEEQNELNEAAAHLDTTNFPDLPTISITAKGHITAFNAGVIALRDGYAEWTPADRIAGVRNLANRATGLAAYLDREFTGIDPDLSDPGSSF